MRDILQKELERLVGELNKGEHLMITQAKASEVTKREVAQIQGAIGACNRLLAKSPEPVTVAKDN